MHKVSSSDILSTFFPFSLHHQSLILAAFLSLSFVIQALSGSLADTGIPDPTKFAFFKGVNTPQSNGVVSVDVTAGVPAGNYRLASINTSANHAPVILPIAQHGMADDMVYVRPSLLPTIPM
jgi:hypothetical protein